MEDEKAVDYAGVLADLRRRRNELDAAIMSLEQIAGMSASAPVQVGSPGIRTGGAVAEIPRNAFHEMRMPEAVTYYLSLVQSKQATKQVLKGLEAGGFEMAAKNPYSAVYTTLVRLEAAGTVVRVGPDWGLAEWYPGLRAKKAKAANDKMQEPQAGEQEPKRAGTD